MYVGVPEVRVSGHKRKNHVRILLLDVNQISVHGLWDTRSLQQQVSLLFRPENMSKIKESKELEGKRDAQRDVIFTKTWDDPVS